MLKDRRLGFRFRRQYAVGPYVLDFYCHEARLCIEVDGEQHADRDEADRKRDAFLADKGILTYRVPSNHLPVQRSGVARYVQHLCVERSERPAGQAELNTPTLSKSDSSPASPLMDPLPRDEETGDCR